MRAALLAFALLAVASPSSGADQPAQQQFLEKSIVRFPRTVGAYTLLDTDYDPAMLAAGITSSWSVEKAPEGLRLNIFVYPQGRASEAEVVLKEIDSVEATVHEAERQGMYSAVVVGERTPFVMAAPEASILDDGKKQAAPYDPKPKPEPSHAPTDASDPVLAALARAEASPNTHGIRQAFRFKRETGESNRSLGYVFYRHLFAFKVRISVPEAAMDEAAFEALADDAARTLVPRIDVQNFGECGSITIPVGDDADKKGKADPDPAVLDAMLGGMTRIQTENCANAEGKKQEPANTRRVEIDYPEGTWKSAGD